MKKTFFTVLFAAAAFAVSLPVTSFAEHEHTPLGEKMEAMAHALKDLKPLLGDATKKDAALASIAKAKESATAARDLEPAKTKDIPEADRAKFIEGYKKSIDGVIATLDKLAVAVKNDKTGEEAAIYAQLGDEKRRGHASYMKKGQ